MFMRLGINYQTPLILRGHKGKALILIMKETKK